MEFVAAPIQSSHDGLGQSAAVELQMLERHFGVVAAVVEIERGHVSETRPEIGRQRKFREVRAPKRRGDKKEAGERGPGAASARYFSRTEAPNE